MFNLDIFLGSRPEIYAEAKSWTKRSHWDVKRSAAICGSSEFVCSNCVRFRPQLHRKTLQFALCYSDASCIVVCVKVAPQHLIVGWQVPPFHTVTLLSHFKDLQIFIGTIIYHVFLKQKWSCKFDCNELLRFFWHMFTMYHWKNCLHKSDDPFHPH